MLHKGYQPDTGKSRILGKQGQKLKATDVEKAQDMQEEKFKRDDSVSSVSSVEDPALASVLATQSGDETSKSKAAQKRQAQREKMKNARKQEEEAGIVGQMFQQQQQKDAPEARSEIGDKEIDVQVAGHPVTPEGYYYPQQPGMPQSQFRPRGQPWMQRPMNPGQYYPVMQQQIDQGAPPRQPFPGQSKLNIFFYSKVIYQNF